MLLAVANTKGGVGKSTLTLQVALGRLAGGRRVWVIDADTQETIAGALQMRADSGLGAVPCASYTDARQLRTQVGAHHTGYDDVIIDVGGRDTAVLRAALMVCEAVLVPFAPQSFEIWAMHDMARVVDEVNGLRGTPLKAWAVMNMASHRPGGSTDDKAAMSAVAAMSTFTLLGAVVTRRKALTVASGHGKSVSEHRPFDGEAVAQIGRLLAEISEREAL